MKVILGMNLLASKRAHHFVRLLALAALCAPFASSGADDQKMDPRITAFVAAKRAQIETIEKDAERPVPKLVQDFFSAFAAQKWPDATNAAEHALRFAESEDAKSDP